MDMDSLTPTNSRPLFSILWQCFQLFPPTFTLKFYKPGDCISFSNQSTQAAQGRPENVTGNAIPNQINSRLFIQLTFSWPVNKLNNFSCDANTVLKAFTPLSCFPSPERCPFCAVLPKKCRNHKSSFNPIEKCPFPYCFQLLTQLLVEVC